MLSACSFPAPTPLPPRQTYTFQPNVAGLAAQQWRPGDKVPVRWAVIPDQLITTTASSGTTYTLTMSLVGPVTSKQEAIDQVAAIKYLDSDRIGTSNWTAKLPEGALKLPPDAQPGQYAIVQDLETLGSKQQAVTMIEVVEK